MIPGPAGQSSSMWYKGVLVVSSSSPGEKLLRSSLHLFRLADAQCGRTGRDARSMAERGRCSVDCLISSFHTR